MKNQSVIANIDWITILIYITLVIMGWMNIYSASLPLEETYILDTSQIYGRQLLFIILTVPIILIVLNINAKIFEKFSVIFYIIGILLLLGLFVFGTSVKGQTNWYKIGGFGFQPSEIVKISCSLLLAKYLSDAQINLKIRKFQYIAIGIIMVPVGLIMLQPETDFHLGIYGLELLLL